MTGHASLVAVLVIVAPLYASAQKAHDDPAVAEVLAFERNVEAAIVRGDVEFMDRACAPTFSFTHGDGWTTGGQPLRVDNRAQWLALVKSGRTRRASSTPCAWKCTATSPSPTAATWRA